MLTIHIENKNENLKDILNSISPNLFAYLSNLSKKRKEQNETSRGICLFFLVQNLLEWTQNVVRNA